MKDLQNIVFLVGALRSGTTLFRLMLGNHPDIHCPGEFDFLFEGFDGNGAPLSIAEYQTQIEHDRIFENSGLTLDLNLSYPQNVRALLHKLLDRSEKEICVINIHRNLDKIQRLLPNARFIHLIRDPRDVANSTINKGWDGNFYTAVRDWIDTENSWDRLKSRCDKNSYIEINYETAVQKPDEELAKICEFLDLPYIDNLSSVDDTSSYSDPNPMLAYQWKRKLSQRQIDLVEMRAGALIKARGYEITNEKNLQRSPSAIRKSYLYTSDRLLKFRARCATFGGGLATEHALRRAFKVDTSKTRKRMNDIEQDIVENEKLVGTYKHNK